MIAAAWAFAGEIQALPPVAGRPVFLWEDHRTDVVSVTAHFPHGPMREGWPELGSVYWRMLPRCLGVAGGVEAELEWATVTLSVRVHKDTLEKAGRAMAKALSADWRCPATNLTDAFDKLREERARDPLARFYSVVALGLYAEGDPRRSTLDVKLSSWFEDREAESLRDEVAGMAGVLTVAGDCDAACATALAGTIFPSAPWKESPRVAKPVVPPAGSNVDEATDGLTQHEVGLAWMTPGASSPDWPAFLVVEQAAQLALRRRLRSQEARVYDVDSSYAATPWPSAWTVSTVVREESVAAVQEGFSGVTRDLRVGADLEEIRGGLRRLRTPADPLERLARAAEGVLAGDDWMPFDRALDAALALNADAVDAYARRLFGAGPAATVHLSPGVAPMEW